MKKEIPGTGLFIRTVTGQELTVDGDVTYTEEYGGIYYCNGRSFPAEIVVEVLGGELMAS